MEVAHPSTTALSHASHRLPLRVYYEDTDAAGVVYYANYLKFCERARTEWLREAGFEQGRLREERGLVFVVRAVQADYLRPAWFDDRIEVVTRIDHIGRASIRFAQAVERNSEVLFQSQITVACVDWHKKKSAAIPQDVRNSLLCMES